MKRLDYHPRDICLARSNVRDGAKIVLVLFLHAETTCDKRNFYILWGSITRLPLAVSEMGQAAPGPLETRPCAFVLSARVVAAKPEKRSAESDFYSERLCGCHAKDAYCCSKHTPVIFGKISDSGTPSYNTP
jgi:hypothetical protein